MEIPDPSFRRRLLIESLTVVAAEASVQVAWLYRHGVLADEIALGFDDAFRLAGRLAEEGLLGREALPALRALGVIFHEMSGQEDAGRWTKNALSTDEGWQQARRLARKVLVAELGEWSLPLPEICVVR
ncbi:hypothetical protein [Streptomyces syringium]|uniref:hypothetical protein n=1 Tax=Streptomyces syringium TaxID=76729 RepID=UPI00339F24F5